MMISTQMLSACSLGIPPRGTYVQSPVLLSPFGRRVGLKWSSGSPEDRGHSTWASKQSSPFTSGAEDASHGGVPAKGTGGCDAAGTKTTEVMDPRAPTKIVDDQLPPLISLVVDGFPPFQISKYIDEAERHLQEYVKRYGNVFALESYYRAGLSAAAYGHPGVISANRLVAISINYALQFLVDDIFFDDPNDFLQDQYGISHDARESPQKIQEYFEYLDALFGQQVQPRNCAPLIETIIWEAGQYTLEVSNPEWFNHYVACLLEHHRGNVASHEDILSGHNSNYQDVESYSIMRASNIGGEFVQSMVELASNNYIPDELRTDPYLKNLTMATSIHLGYVNDVYSYHKESLIEQNPRNLISVLLKCEGKPFEETMHMTIDLINKYAHEILDLESQAWNSTLRIHLQGIKALIAGGVYFGLMDDRYRHPNSCFPELRDMTSSWKILPNAKGQGL